MLNRMKNLWTEFREKHLGVSQFIVFFIICNGVTVLQMLIMPLFKQFFGTTDLVNINFQIGQLGSNFDGSSYYVFNYAKGLLSEGGGGGLAYFLAVQIAMAIAQIINFFLQRNVTFKSDGNMAKAVFWYVLAYVIITIGAAAAQGLYKSPVYNLFINTWNGGKAGETAADVITMLINSTISFWVFFPIFKVIFKNKPQE